MTLDELKPGMKVRFHPIIGGMHDQNVYTVKHPVDINGQKVVFLHEKDCCVSPEALSPVDEGDTHDAG